MEALKQKAKRGELFFTVAVGCVKVGRDKIEKDPDLRVCEAIGLVFDRFAEMQSIRQVVPSLRAERIERPDLACRGTGQYRVSWKLPVQSTVGHLLPNPVYAGAYAFGRTGGRTTIDNGRKRVSRGAVRKGDALLAGLLRCGHCGRRPLAGYDGAKGHIGRCGCDATRSNPGASPCISFGALRDSERPATLSVEERDRLPRLGADLEAAWHHPGACLIRAP